MWWILLKFATFAPERRELKLLRGYLILIRFVVVIVISILASLFWNTVYISNFSEIEQSTMNNCDLTMSDFGAVRYLGFDGKLTGQFRGLFTHSAQAYKISTESSAAKLSY